MGKNMVQVFEYNSETNAFKVCSNFEMQDSFIPCSQITFYHILTILSL